MVVSQTQGTLPQRSNRQRKWKLPKKLDERTGYVPYSHAVSPAFRQLVLAQHPALTGDGKEPWAYRRIMEYVLFAPYLKDPDGNRRQILPFRTVAALVGVLPNTKGYSAWDWLDRFSREVLDLRATGYRMDVGRARRIDPHVDPNILAVMRQKLPTELGTLDNERVYFVSGDPVTHHRYWKTRKHYEERIRKLATAQRDTSNPLADDHPAADWIEYLNSQPGDCLDAMLKANWGEVVAEWEKMPESTKTERMKRDAVYRVLKTLPAFRKLIYQRAVNTTRIHTVGNTIHQLPRDYRKLFLKDAITLDLRQAQLAIAARLWNVQSLQAFLGQEGASIWEELYAFLEVDKSTKRMLKKTVYSIVYGMPRANLIRNLSSGVDGLSGIGVEKARKLFTHPIIMELMTARDAAQTRIEERRGVEDAFGRWNPLEGKRKRQGEVRSLLALQIQSYEMRIMLSLLPVLKKEKDIRVLSFLHDSITIWIIDKTEGKRKIDTLIRTVREQAAALGINTGLERES